MIDTVDQGYASKTAFAPGLRRYTAARHAKAAKAAQLICPVGNRRTVRMAGGLKHDSV